MDVTALSLGELTLALEVENNLGRGLAEAKREVSSLSPHVQQEMNKVVAEMDRGGKAGGLALGNGLVRDASGRLRNARGQLASDAEVALAGIAPVAESRGQDSGGVLAQGMRSGLIRNSPLIAAAVGGALAAGAPAVLTASTALFAGVGIVAAAQSEKVQSAWLGTWQAISRDAQVEARPIETTLVNLSARVQSRFQELRPVLSDIFLAASPQIDVFADGLLGLVENVLPGFQRAIERGMPVTQGFASFLEKTGIGLTGFLDGMSEHSAAAGQVFDMLGDTMAQVLPLLGDLIGTGAELATGVLPLLNGSLKTLNAALDILSPVLPTIVAGFVGMKAIGALTGVLDNVAGGLERIGTRAGMTTDGVTRFRGAISAAGFALPILGAAIGVAVNAFTESDRIQKANTETFARWAQGINQGGAAAAATYQEMARAEQAFTAMFGEGAYKNVLASDQMTAARKRGNEMEAQRRASLTDSQRASEDLAAAEYKLEKALESSTPSDDAAAWDAYEQAQRDAADASDANSLAIRGVTEAMNAAADQARSEVDAQFAYANAIDNVQDSYGELLSAIQEHGVASEEAEDATRAYNESLQAQVTAAQAAATSELPAALDDQQRAMIGNKAALDELNGLIAAGVVLPPSMEEYRLKLERITGEADGAKLAQALMAAGIAEVGYAVTSLPDGKTVQINGIEPDKISPIRDGLRDLGFEVITLPDGKTVEVRALTDEAQGNVANISALLTALGLMPPPIITPQVDPQPVIDGVNTAVGAVNFLDGTSANPLADLADDPLVGKALADLGLLGNLGEQRPAPVADLMDDPLVAAAVADLGLLGNLAGQTPTPVAALNDSPLTGTVANDMGQLLNLASQHAIPLSSLNDGSLVGTYLNDMGLLGNLSGQTPTPTSYLNDQPVISSVNSVEERLRVLGGQRPTPIVDVWDWATGPLQGIKRWLDSIQSKTVTLTVEQRVAGGATVNSVTGPAEGGQLGSVTRKIKRATGGTVSGKVSGPGSTTSDNVGPFLFPGGQAYLSNLEWIIKAASAMNYGDARMAAINAGTATVLMPSEAAKLRRHAGGGLVASASGSMTGEPARAISQPVRGGNSYQIDLHMHGVDFSKAQDRRRVLAEIRSGLREMDRELA